MFTNLLGSLLDVFNNWKMEINTGADEVGSNNGHEQTTEVSSDTSDGNCLGLGVRRRTDENNASGISNASYSKPAAQMSMPKYATHYKMDHKKRGIGYIFNHEVFQFGGFKPRSGTDADCIKLTECLIGLGFDVRVFKDLNYDRIHCHIRDAVQMDHSHHDCILVAVLSYGEMGMICANDKYYKPDDLWSPFTADKCPSLAGKPKLFFLQASQGDKLIKANTETDGGKDDSTYRIPVQADFLIVYSTVKGSRFIQSLVEELEKKAHNFDLMTILTFVFRRIALEFENNVPDLVTMHLQKKIPCAMSRLTRLIQFKNKN